MDNPALSAICEDTWNALRARVRLCPTVCPTRPEFPMVKPNHSGIIIRPSGGARPLRLAQRFRRWRGVAASSLHKVSTLASPVSRMATELRLRPSASATALAVDPGLAATYSTMNIRWPREPPGDAATPHSDPAADVRHDVPLWAPSEPRSAHPALLEKSLASHASGRDSSDRASICLRMTATKSI